LINYLFGTIKKNINNMQNSHVELFESIDLRCLLSIIQCHYKQEFAGRGNAGMLFITKLRRNRMKNRPFPPAWERGLECVPLYRRLPEHDRKELKGHILVFLAEKSFEGCGGFEMTDETRLMVAAQACILLLHRETDYFPGLSSIIIYPDEYLAPLQEVDEIGVVTECFFERPMSLRNWDTELFLELSGYYRQNPAEWEGAKFN